VNAFTTDYPAGADQIAVRLYCGYLSYSGRHGRRRITYPHSRHHWHQVLASVAAAAGGSGSVLEFF
jgi:hypothetical protein